jgi:RNA polymerase sigma-70 factor (ECF subfamily)
MSPRTKADLDRASFERAVREHHGAVYAAALRVTRDQALAMDAAQQTFLRVLEGKLDLAGAASPQRWLRCAAAREALMVLRAARNRRRREEQHAMERHERFEESTSESADTLRALRRALEELPEELRTALALRFHEELTYSEMGDVLAISEPSAHQRVQRGLAKLRERLTNLGLASLAPDLAGLVKRVDLAHGAPAELEAKLLALGGASKAALSSVAATWIAATALVSIASVGAWNWIGRGSSTASTSSATNTVTLASESAARAAGSSATPEGLENTAKTASSRLAAPSAAAPTREQAPEASTPLPHGVLEGRVVDEFGLPLEGVDVRASSIERHSKLAEFGGATKSARDGSFRLSLPAALESGQDYALVASTPTYAHDAGVHRVRAGATCAPQRIQLAREVVERPGAWQLWLSVRDEQGRPVANAAARLHWIARNADAVQWWQQQSAARSEADGAATLEGEGLGRKLLAVDARDAGFAPHFESLELSAPGATHFEVVLKRGVEIVGTLVDLNGAPLSRSQLGEWNTPLYATGVDRNVWYAAEFLGPGRFRIPALARAPHELHFQHERWSSFTLHDVVPGEGELRLQLKLKDDPTDLGTHRAELHGRLVDAASGAPVRSGALTTWLERVPDDSPALVDGDFAPLVMEAVIVQVAAGFAAEGDQPPPPPENAFIYDDLAPGRYAVRVRARGYAPTLVGPLELGEREIASGIQVRLLRGATVEGVLVDEHGAPVGGAYVLPLGDGELSRRRVAELDRDVRSSGGRGLVRNSAVRTDAQGRFSVVNVPTDRALRLCAVHPGREPAHGAWLELREGASANVELRAGAPRER